jgi:3-hydroxyacyl-CoA dehydrogenase
MEIRTVAIIGAGVMGAQIGQVLAIGGRAVRLHDVDAGQLDTARERIEHDRFGLRMAVERGKLTADQAAAALGRITTTADLAAACADADLVVEAVPEDIGLKVRVFRHLDRVAPPRAILASNTAGLPIAALAYATDRPEQVLGWHWFQPCAVMRAVEIVVHDGVASESRDALGALSVACGKRPQVVRDQPLVWGFVANRINRAVRLEAARIVAEGIATEEQVDALMRDGFRWAMGPFELMRGGSLK